MKASQVLIGIGASLIIICIFIKTENFMDVGGVVKKQFRLFKKAKSQYLIYYVSPVFIGAGIAFENPITDEIIGNLNVVISILVAVLFSVLSVIVSWTRKSENETADEKFSNLKDETVNTILFEALISVTLMIIGFIALFLDLESEVISLGLSIVSGVIYALTFIALLQIFIIFKRIEALYQQSTNT